MEAGTLPLPLQGAWWGGEGCYWGKQALSWGRQVEGFLFFFEHGRTFASLLINFLCRFPFPALFHCVGLQAMHLLEVSSVRSFLLWRKNQLSPAPGLCYWKDSLALRNFLFLKTARFTWPQAEIEANRTWVPHSFLTDCDRFNRFAKHILWEATTESRWHWRKILPPFSFFSLPRDTFVLTITLFDCFGFFVQYP